MPYTTLIDEKQGIIETTLTGLATAQDIIEIMKQDVEIAISKKCYYWINDFSEAEYDMSTFEIYDFPKELMRLAERLGPERYRIKRAIVSSRIDENQKFAQLVSVNRGQSLGLFDSIEEARKWITEKIDESA